MPGILEPAVQFHEWFSRWMADNKYFGTTVSRKRYTCEKIGADSLPAYEFCEKFHVNTEAMSELGKLLGIEGYDDCVDLMRRSRQGVNTFNPEPLTQEEGKEEDSESTEEGEPENG
jgi:hypothetical protein